MKKQLTIFLTALLLALLGSCDKNDSLQNDTYEDIILQVSETTVWEPVWGNDEHTVEHMLVKEPSDAEWQKLVVGSIEGFEYVRGHAYELEVRKTTLANPPADGSRFTYKLLAVVSDVPVSTPSQPEELPEEAKFKLQMVQLTPFMNLDTPLAAPFDFLTFRILDHRGEYNVLGDVQFLQYYDSIVMSSPAMPETYRIYQKEADENSTATYLTSQWRSHFFAKSDFQIFLQGYKDSEMIYEHSIGQPMRERDFIGVDWTKGSISLANPQTMCIYCLLDSRYEFLLTDTQQSNNTSFVKIQVAYSSGLTDSEYLEKQEAGLKWLLKEYLGSPSALPASDFKTLPEDAEIVEVYENSTTRAALLYFEGNDLREACFAVVAEGK